MAIQKIKSGDVIEIEPGNHFALKLPDGTMLQIEQTNDVPPHHSFEICLDNKVVYSRPTIASAKDTDGFGIDYPADPIMPTDAKTYYRDGIIYHYTREVIYTDYGPEVCIQLWNPEGAYMGTMQEVAHAHTIIGWMVNAINTANQDAAEYNDEIRLNKENPQ